MRKCNFGKLKHKCDTHKIGSSSFKMHNKNLIINEFNLKQGERVLDLGCGPGDYSIEISKIVGNEGQVFSIDQNKEVIDYLNERIKNKNIVNIETFVSDIKKEISLEDNSVDVCLIITVLHTLNIKEIGKSFFTEIKRILKLNGRLITINVKKEKQDFGPPLSMRISSDELKEIVERKDFKESKLLDLGYTYLMEFEVNK